MADVVQKLDDISHQAKMELVSFLKPFFSQRKEVRSGGGLSWEDVGLGCSGQAAYAVLVTSISGLVAYWRLGEPAGNQLDYAHNPLGDKPLTRLVGTTVASYDVTGAPIADDDGAVQLNYNMVGTSASSGDGDAFSADDSSHHRWAFASTDPFTASLWLKWKSGWSVSTSTPSQGVMLVGTQQSIGSGFIPGWSLLLGASTTGMFLQGRRGDSGGPDSQVDDLIAVPANTWTHAALTYDGATLRLYHNGALSASVSSTHANATEATIFVGAGSTWNSIYNMFYGALDEVAIWNVALTGAQIESLAAAGGF